MYGFALCDAGEIAIDGGAEIEPLPGAPFPPIASSYIVGTGPVYSFPAPQNNGWQTLAYNGSGQTLRLITDVVCVSTNNSLRVTDP